MFYMYKTAKTKEYEDKMEAMMDESFDYKFKHRWNYYDGYTAANFERSTALGDYRDNLNNAFFRLNKFNKLSAEEQKKVLENPYSGGNYHITFDMGYVDFYHDSLAKKYKLTQEQFEKAKECSAKQNNTPLEKVIRNTILFAPDGMFDAEIKAKIVAEDKQSKATKTQEKIVKKVDSKKSDTKKKPQRSR